MQKKRKYAELYKTWQHLTGHVVKTKEAGIDKKSGERFVIYLNTKRSVLGNKSLGRVKTWLLAKRNKKSIKLERGAY